jgi:hypothetical protein
MMVARIDEIPGFERVFLEYCKRQERHPGHALVELECLIQTGRGLVPLDESIKGLHAMPLPAPLGGDETLLLIDHRNGSQRYSVCVSVLDRPLKNFVWPCSEHVCKSKINLAVAKLIMMSKSCGPAPKANVI